MKAGWRAPRPAESVLPIWLAASCQASARHTQRVIYKNKFSAVRRPCDALFCTAYGGSVTASPGTPPSHPKNEIRENLHCVRGVPRSSNLLPDDNTTAHLHLTCVRDPRRFATPPSFPPPPHSSPSVLGARTDLNYISQRQQIERS